MKKVLILVLALLMVTVSAYGEGIDLSSMTVEQLIDLHAQVEAEITAKTSEKANDVISGRLICGETIKPGTYSITLMDTSLNAFGIFSDNNQNEPFYSAENADYKHDGFGPYIITLHEGEVLVLYDAVIKATEPIG